MGRGVTVDGWLDRQATSEFLNVSGWWLEAHIHDSSAPPYIKHGRKVWYRRIDLIEWLRDEGRVAQVRKECGPVLEAVSNATSRRPDPVTPPVSELMEKYVAEHGDSSAVSMPREVWDALKLTLTFRQRRLVANKIQPRT